MIESIYFLLIAIFGGLLITIVPHELGHLVMYKIFGGKLYAAHLYFINLYKDTENNKFKLDIPNKQNRKTSVACYKKGGFTWIQILFIYLAGPMTNLMIGITLIIAYISTKNILALIFAVESFYDGVKNLILVQIEESDGSIIKRLLNKETREHEILRINIANKIVTEQKIDLDDIDKLMSSENIFYMKTACIFMQSSPDPKIKRFGEREMKIILEKELSSIA